MTSNDIHPPEFCAFCYRSYLSPTPNGKTQCFNKFTKLLGRYLGDDNFNKSFDIDLFNDLSFCNIGSCKDCTIRIKEFCDLYHQYKCLQLHLQWKIIKLVDIIKLANKVPSKVSQLKTALLKNKNVEDGKELTTECDKLRMLQKFRHQIVKKCHCKLKKSQPLVSTIQWTDNDKTPILRALLQTNTKPENELKPDDSISNFDESCFEATIRKKTSNSAIFTKSTEDGFESGSSNNRIIIENCPGDETMENIILSPYCDDNVDPLTCDQIDEMDILDYNEGANTPVANGTLLTSQIVLSSLKDASENPNSTENEMLLSPSSLIIENVVSTTPTCSSHLHFKTESNIVNCSSLTNERPEYSDLITSTEEDNPISTNTISDASNQNLLNLQQSSHTNNSNDLQDQPVTCLNEELIVTEMQQHENIGTEIKNENNIKSMNEIDPQQRYNLRRKRAPNFSLQEDDESNDNDNDQEYSDNDSNCSSSSNSSNEEITNIIREQGPMPSPDKKGKFRCRLEECFKKFGNEKIYRDHVKLHSTGKFPCNFCKVVACSVITLANHEHTKHNQNSTDTGKEKQCPRCLLKFKFSLDYEDHFAYTHFQIGENPETKEKRRGPGQPRNSSIYPPNHFQNTPIITCEVCKRKIPRTYKTVHMKTWHDKKSNNEIKKCKYEGCKAYFLTDKQLNSHSKSHLKQAFCCTICQNSFSERILLRRHMRQKHNEPIIQDIGTDHQPEALPCNFCHFTSNIPRNLAIHEEKEHVPTQDHDLNKNSKKPHRCPRCPYKYGNHGCYIIHHLTKHLNVLSVDSSNACKLCSGKKKFVLNSTNHFNQFHNTNLLDDPTKIFKCDVENCPAYFVKSRQLYCHQTGMHPILSCLKCEKTFKLRCNLRDHLRSCQISHVEKNHPNLSVSCDNPTCAIMFQSEEEMKMHQIYAHPKKPKKAKEQNFVCVKCGKCFKSIGGMKLHLRAGHVESTFVCSECGKKFRYKHNLDKHMIFHKGPDTWEYQCSECGKKCVDKQKLEEHLRSHTKEKPFVCQFCGGKYAHRHNWRNHLKTKHADEKGIDEIVGSGKKGNYVSRKGSKKGDCIMASSKSV